MRVIVSSVGSRCTWRGCASRSRRQAVSKAAIETHWLTPSESPPRDATTAAMIPPGGRLRAVLFDVDGTLTHSDAVHFTVFQKFLRQHKFVPPAAGEGGAASEVISEAFFKEHISGALNEELFPRLFPSASPEELAAMIAQKEELFRREAADMLKPLPGLHEFVEALQASGVQLCAVTNAPRENAELMLECIGLSHVFLQSHGPGGSRLVVGSECPRGKPHADPYLEGLRRCGLSADEAAKYAVAFEDSTSGVKAAVAAGLTVFGVTTTRSCDALKAVGAADCVADYRAPVVQELLSTEVAEV